MWTWMISSILEAVAYNPATRRLRIRFRTGAIYDYHDVPPFVFEELLAAPSKGRYFFEYIRPEYEYRRVRCAEERAPATVG